MKNKIVFFGGVGSPAQFGGEPTKNKEIIKRLKELGAVLTVIDCNNARSHPWKLLKIMSRLFVNLLFHSQATFIFSTSFGNIYPFFKILYWLPVRRHIVYWVIGGTLPGRVADGAYKKKYLLLIDLFITEGIKMKKRMMELGFDNVSYRPNFKTILSLPAIHKFEDGCIHFFFLSRITRHKGCSYIFDCMNRLNDEGWASKYVVDFYGSIDDEYKEEFQKSIQTIFNARYQGCINLQEFLGYETLAKYHYMLFPTFWFGEGFPGVIIDAYTAGVPIISSDWNLNPEFVIDGKTGIVVPAHDVERLLDAMRGAVEGCYPNAEMSVACQEAAMKYDTRNVIDQELFDMITTRNTLKPTTGMRS